MEVIQPLPSALLLYRSTSLCDTHTPTTTPNPTSLSTSPKQGPLWSHGNREGWSDPTDLIVQLEQHVLKAHGINEVENVFPSPKGVRSQLKGTAFEYSGI